MRANQLEALDAYNRLVEEWPYEIATTPARVGPSPMERAVQNKGLATDHRMLRSESNTKLSNSSVDCAVTCTKLGNGFSMPKQEGDRYKSVVVLCTVDQGDFMWCYSRSYNQPFQLLLKG